MYRDHIEEVAIMLVALLVCIIFMLRRMFFRAEAAVLNMGPTDR